MSELKYWHMVRYFGGWRYRGKARFRTAEECIKFNQWMDTQNGN